MWRTAPASWVPRLEQLHPHGSNLRQVDLTNYGFVMTQPYFVGPAVDVSFVPNQPPIPVGFSPYASPVFAPYLDPGYVAVGAAAAGLAGIVGGVLPGPHGFGPPDAGMPGGFRPGPGFGPPGGFGPGGFGPGGFGPGGGRVLGLSLVDRDTWPGLAVLGDFGGPMGMPGHGHGGGAWDSFGGPMMGRPGGMPRGRTAGRNAGGNGWPPGGMPMAWWQARRDADGRWRGRPGGMPMGMAGRPGGMPMMGWRPTRRDAHDGGGRPGGMPTMGGGRPARGRHADEAAGGRPATPAVHMAAAPGRHR